MSMTNELAHMSMTDEFAHMSITEGQAHDWMTWELTHVSKTESGARGLSRRAHTARWIRTKPTSSLCLFTRLATRIPCMAGRTIPGTTAPQVRPPLCNPCPEHGLGDHPRYLGDPTGAARARYV